METRKNQVKTSKHPNKYHEEGRKSQEKTFKYFLKRLMRLNLMQLKNVASKIV
jgi:hypothetical protein